MEYMGFVNLTKFKAEHYLLADEKGSDILVFVVKATYNITANDKIEIAEEQTDIYEAPEYYGEPGESAMKYDSEVYYMKQKADAVLIGYAQSPGKTKRRLDVAFRVGDVHKIIRVFGDRSWKRPFGFWKPSNPKPFDKIELRYENAFGGMDNSHKKEKHHNYESRNPVGTGFVSKKSAKKIKEIKLPNIENPKDLIKKPKNNPEPSGFGFLDPGWAPRIKKAGTYDDIWEKETMPLLPDDFDQAFYNSASPALISDDYFMGGQQVGIVNASPSGKINFTLPEVLPEAIVKMKDGTRHQLDMNLDTVIVNTDENKVNLIWRNHLNVYKKVHKILWAKTQLKNGETE